MNRERKYRAWDGLTMYPFSMDQIDGGSILVLDTSPKSRESWASLKDLIVMDYTGLKDKNGKEIYEGDIVTWEDTGSNFPNKLYKKEKVEWVGTGWYGFSRFYDNTVIGNIYENPDLLK